MAGKYKYLTFEDRQKIEAWHARGDRPLEIAARLGVHTATIYNELKQGYVGELDSRQWRIVTNMSEQGVSFFSDTVAEVKIERKTDKRIKYAEGRGVILSAAVSFREELLPLSLDSARRFLLEENRQEYIKRMEEIRQKAVHEAEEAATEIARLLKLKF